MSRGFAIIFFILCAIHPPPKGRGLLAEKDKEATIVHRDGSILHFNSAFLMRAGDCIICFTEHHKHHVFEKIDLMMFWESNRLHDKIEEMK